MGAARTDTARFDMTQERHTPELDIWVERARAMAAYRDEALDFLERAAAQLPVGRSDVGAVCRLWAVADECDEMICEALTRFDAALFESKGELDITRGVEAPSAQDAESRAVFTCAWSIERPEGRRISCVLSAERLGGALGLEIRDAQGAAAPLPFPLEYPSDLYEALANAFFRMATGEA